MPVALAVRSSASSRANGFSVPRISTGAMFSTRAATCDVSGLRGRKRRHAAGDVGQMRRVVRLDVEVRKLHLAVAHLDVADRHGGFLRCRRRRWRRCGADAGGGVDAGFEAGFEAGVDAGVEAGVEAGTAAPCVAGAESSRCRLSVASGLTMSRAKNWSSADRAERDSCGGVSATSTPVSVSDLPAHELLRRRPVERAEVADRHVAREVRRAGPAGERAGIA